MSEIKVNKISPRTNCGTVQLGDSGDTITIPAGATITNNGTQTGFGREGSVDWQTGSIKTASSFTAVSGEGYFVDTSSNAITANLPAGSAGAIVAFSDYARNFNTNNLTVAPNGSEKIGGIAADMILDVNGQALTLVYVDGTKGWINVQNAEDTETGVNFLTATGGTESTSGNFKIHTFTGPGTFTVNTISPVAPNNTVDYLVVAGGGSGAYFGGGGGAGGLRYYATGLPSPAPATPINNNSPAPGTSIAVTASAFPITVGAGGAKQPSTPNNGNSGSASSFSTVTSAGGGGGGAYAPSTGNNGLDGGSGGGAGNGEGSPGGNGGSGNTPVVSPIQGNPGGTAGKRQPGQPTYGAGGAGGGAMAAGAGVPTNCGASPAGTNGGVGAGFTCGHFGSSNGQCSSCVQYFSGGGGGTSSAGPVGGSGGLGGGGQAAPNPSAPNTNVGIDGTANTGGGGGGNRGGPAEGAGGSGIVVIRYRFQ